MTSRARPPESARIAVFAKAPIPGAVKTRLAAVLSPREAASLHERLVLHALATAVRACAGEVELWCDPDPSHPFFERCARESGATLKRQRGADLGERMRHAFEEALGAGHALVIIGSDCPALSPESLRTALDALRANDAVVTPAEDGGYVLLGISRPVPGLFEGVAWGSAHVMEQTRARLAAGGFAWKEFETSWDVDRPEDYARLRREGLLREALR
jgi:rSAM/selenodomain-associated transferase 1